MTDRSSDRISRRQTLAALIAAGMVPALARGAKAADFGAFNAGYARQVVLPAMGNLAAATRDLARAATAACVDPAKPDLPKLRAAFDAAADAWADAQMFRLGPLAENQRAERLAYWPERRNIIDKQLAALLASDDVQTLDTTRLGASSVAVQGLPALERLIYQEAPPAQACAVISAIAGNLSAIAEELLTAWQQAAGEDPAPFAANPVEATTQFYTNLLTLLQIVADQKIGAVLGGDLAAARPKAAEQWRSGRSARNIRRNLGAAEAAFFADAGFVTFLGDAQQALREDLRQAFVEARATADAIGDDLPADVATAERRPLVTMLLVKVNHLRDLLRQDVPPAIGITLGFNELDGDGS
ncbi:MAG: imelysin family protein [Rhodospirillaceae bacterium]|nr:imelysin family protein [Rhodospirillaceae bacterium]